MHYKKKNILYTEVGETIEIQSKANDVIHCTQSNIMYDWH